MGIYLKIGSNDVSRFITENEYSVITAPVYDEDSAFINIYGEKIRDRTGLEVTISAKLYDVDDASAAAISSALSSGSANVIYSAPEECSASFDTLKLAISLDRVYKGVKYWTAEILLHAFIREGSL